MAALNFDSERRRWRLRYKRPDGTTTSKRFESESEAREFARTHGVPIRKHGPRTADQIAAEIAQKIHKTASGCHEWTGTLTGDGYAQAHWTVGDGSIIHTGHRISYTLARGRIAAGLQIDHLCRNVKCVNPDHLEAVTPRENVLRQPRHQKKAAAS